MDNIEELLRALADDDENDNDERTDKNEKSERKSETEGNQSGGLFSALDPEMLIKLLGLFETLNQPDDNERFLLALKPLLREENRAKIDAAARMLKLFSILPLLKQSGMLDNLANLL